MIVQICCLIYFGRTEPTKYISCKRWTVCSGLATRRMPKLLAFTVFEHTLKHTKCMRIFLSFSLPSSLPLWITLSILMCHAELSKAYLWVTICLPDKNPLLQPKKTYGLMGQWQLVQLWGVWQEKHTLLQDQHTLGALLTICRWWAFWRMPTYFLNKGQHRWRCKVQIKDMESIMWTVRFTVLQECLNFTAIRQRQHHRVVCVQLWN